MGLWRSLGRGSEGKAPEKFWPFTSGGQTNTFT